MRRRVSHAMVVTLTNVDVVCMNMYLHTHIYVYVNYVYILCIITTQHAYRVAHRAKP
jgi:hypothetical protein